MTVLAHNDLVPDATVAEGSIVDDIAQGSGPSWLDAWLARLGGDPLLFQQWSHQASDVPKAWQTTRGREDVLVAVLDSGVDYNHPDLVGRVINGPDFGEGKDGRDIDDRNAVDGLCRNDLE